MLPIKPAESDEAVVSPDKATQYKKAPPLGYLVLSEEFACGVFIS